MGRSACLAILAALVGCSDDDSGSGGGDAGVRDGSGAGKLLLSGTGCEGAVTYTLAGDERIVLYTNATSGLLEALMVLDGPFFDTQSEAAWQSYAAANDTFSLIAFSDPEPVTAHTITMIFDSFFGGRNSGVLAFAEHGAGERVEITLIDTTTQTIEVDFTLPVWGSTPAYPPAFDAIVDCMLTTPGSVTGSISGRYETMSF